MERFILDREHNLKDEQTIPQITTTILQQDSASELTETNNKTVKSEISLNDDEKLDSLQIVFQF